MSTLGPSVVPTLRPSTGESGGGGGLPAPDVLTGLYEVWEFDEASFGNAGGTEQAPTAGLYWAPNNGVSSVTGILDNGPGSGAIDLTNSSGSFRMLLSGTDAAHSTNTLKNQLFGAGATKRSASWSQWWYPTVDKGTGAGTLLNLGSSLSQGIRLRYGGSTHATLSNKVYVNFPGVANFPDVGYTLNAWNFTVWSWDNDGGELYIWNGHGGTIEAATATPASAPLTTTQPVHLKAYDFADTQPGQFYGDQCALWTNRAIGLSEVTALYNNGLGVLRSNWGSL